MAVNRFRYSSLKRAEEAIRDKQDGETLVVFDAQGKYVFSLTVPGKTISFSDAQFARMKNCIVVHNHSQGTSFGDTDIRAACYAQVREMRIVTRQHTYSMRPPLTGWNDEFWEKVVNPARLQAETNIFAELGRRFTAGEITQEQWLLEGIDRTWRQVAAQTGMVYSNYARGSNK